MGLTKTVIHTDGLSKRYDRGVIRQTLLRDHIARLLRSPLSTLQRTKANSFWALKDVSIDIREGEVLGLIGRNGAGKTTLLKILCRITRPTEGRAEIHGRIGSLLEVGTGFHPELTGRENAFLSGAILGMSRREIARKFDEIVAFAEIEKFIDTPVKHYSSGMHVRLAFAVAAHLNPEILLIDEVLAVGDIKFQKKCLVKMDDVSRTGRTIVLVSHQLNQIRRLCHRVMWIDNGSVRADGATHKVVSAYESAMGRTDIITQRPAGAGNKARFIAWEIVEPRGSGQTLTTHGPVTLKFRLQVFEGVCRCTHGIALYNSDRNLVWGRAIDNVEFEAGEHAIFYSFPSLPLRPGPYSWLLSLFDETTQLDMWDAVPEMIVATDNYQHPRDEWGGFLNVPTEVRICAE